MMKLQNLRARDAKLKEKLKDVSLKDVNLKGILTKCGASSTNAGDLLRCIFTSAVIWLGFIMWFRGGFID